MFILGGHIIPQVSPQCLQTSPEPIPGSRGFLRRGSPVSPKTPSSLVSQHLRFLQNGAVSCNMRAVSNHGDSIMIILHAIIGFFKTFLAGGASLSATEFRYLEGNKRTTWVKLARIENGFKRRRTGPCASISDAAYALMTATFVSISLPSKPVVS